MRALLAVYARHQALNAYFTAKAEQAGLDTERALELLAAADRQSQRAERVLVTLHDLARAHAAKEPPIARGALPPGFKWVDVGWWGSQWRLLHALGAATSRPRSRRPTQGARSTPRLRPMRRSSQGRSHG